MKRILLAFSFVALCATAPSAAGLLVVPEGNRHKEQPKVPGSSVRRTEAGKTTFDEKYEKIRDLLARDKALIAKVKTNAAAYGIDPIHMVGALVGEHTYNIDAYDQLQTYYIKAASYAGNSFRFGYGEETISQFVSRPEFGKCAEFLADSYRLWTCRETVWDKSFRGRTVKGATFPNDRFSAVFFQPFYAGQTFGLGQENPLTALMLTDMVAKTSGYPKLDENKAADVYAAIMDPDKSLAYMAAIIRRAIDDYKAVGVDISKNPGITATLYNTGGSAQRAAALDARGSRALPEENYYGWLVNDKLAELKALIADAPTPNKATGSRPD